MQTVSGAPLLPGAPRNLKLCRQITGIPFHLLHSSDATTMKLSSSLRAAAKGNYLVLQGVARTFLPSDVQAALAEIGASRSGAPTLGTSLSLPRYGVLIPAFYSDETTRGICATSKGTRHFPTPIERNVPPDIPIPRIRQTRHTGHRPFPLTVPRFPSGTGSGLLIHRAKGTGETSGARESRC